MDVIATPAAVLSIMVKAQGVQAASTQLTSLDRTARKAGTGVATMEGHAKRTSGVLRGLGSVAKLAAGTAGIAGLAVAGKRMSEEFREAQKTGAQTTAVLKSTHGAAKTTKKSIEDLSNAISKKSGIDDENIQQSANMLLTFTKLRNETGKGNKVFDQATQTVTDMSVALGQSGKSSAIQLGKALNDPVKGITALRRVGVSFDDQQKKQIGTMVKSGNVLGAQKVILKELNKEFGGSAAAQATAGDKFRVAIGNLAEAAGGILMPQIDKVAGALTRFLTGMTEGTGAGGKFVDILGSMASKAGELWTAIAPLRGAVAAIFNWLVENPNIAAIIGGIAAAMWLLNAAVAANPFVLLGIAIAALVVGLVAAYRESSTFRDIVNAAFNAVKAVVQAVMPTVVSVVQAAFGAIKTAAGWVQTAFSNVVSWVRGAMNSVTTEVNKWHLAAAVVQAAITVIKTYISVGFKVISTIAKAEMAVLIAVFRVAWNVVKAVFSGAITILKGVIQGAGQIFSGAVKVIEGILRGDFHRIWDGIKTIFSGGITIIKGVLTGSVQALSGAAAAIGNGIKAALTGAFHGAVNVVAGFVVSILKIIDKIPGVDMGGAISFVQGLANSGGGASKAVGNTAQGQTHGLARGGAFGLTGGTVNAPMVMMGEEAPRYPEYVIPTNPAYRNRARGLLGQASMAVGGLARGGIVGLAGGGAVEASSHRSASSLIGSLPSASGLPSWMGGMGNFALAAVGGFIKDKVAAFLSAKATRAQVAAGPGGGGDQATSISGLVPRVVEALAFARAHGWKGQVNSGFRSDAEQVRIWNSGIRPAAKPKSLGGPGSNHSLGQAVDVSDIPGFQAAMNMMPANKRLYSRVANDPVHFSVTGNKRGGIVGLKGGGVVGNVRAVWQFLRGKGMTPAQAAGIIGTMQGESGKGLSTTATNPGPDHAYGIAQWLGSRKTALMAKNNPSSLQTQLDFLWSELQGPESAAYSRIKGAHSIPDAVVAWMDGFERGSPAERTIGARTANARNVFSSLQGVGGSTARGGGGSNAASGAASTAAKVNPLDQSLATADLAIEQAKHGGTVKAPGIAGRKISSAMRQVGALTNKRALISKRIASIRKALKGKPSASKRLALTQELTQRLQEHSQLGTDIAALRNPAAADTGGGGIGGDVGGGAVGDTTDPNQPLIDAINAAAEQAAEDARIKAEADAAHTAALQAATAEVKRQTDFATSVSNTSNFQLTKGLADLLSGQIVGYGVAGRRMTPGSGVEFQY